MLSCSSLCVCVCMHPGHGSRSSHRPEEGGECLQAHHQGDTGGEDYEVRERLKGVALPCMACGGCDMWSDF